ncbi:TPA: 6-phosphogluconolactonase [Morganella morganii]|uniref:6-phosphogluconolactonase n=1 Tax=Morganella morganii TaxID=582 RepID=A0AAN5RZQ7_MORMO|nr:6-phosphogluconolactonase [Morganella morganii]
MKQVVYVASTESHQIHVWQMNEHGEMSLLQTVSTPDQVQPLITAPDGGHLYAAVKPGNAVVTYKIAEDGKLTQTGLTPLPGTAAYITLDKAGRTLYAASYHQGNLAVLPIRDNGLPARAVQVIEGLKNPHSANIAQDGCTLFVPCLGEDHIRAYTIEEDGRLTERHADMLTVAAGAGPRHMAFHPAKHVAYCLNELNATINVYREWVKVREIQSVDMMADDYSGRRWAADIHITPDGRHLYACERASSVINHYRVSDDGGHLQLAGRYPTETQPRGFAVDNSGRFLISTGQLSHHVAVSRIDDITGELHFINRYPAGKGPMWVTVLTLK